MYSYMLYITICRWAERTDQVSQAGVAVYVYISAPFRRIEFLRAWPARAS